MTRIDVPRIMSVDDDVAEPAHVWQTSLPDEHRERGPRLERQALGSCTFGVRLGEARESGAVDMRQCSWWAA